MIAKAETLVGRIQVAQVDLEQVINRLKRALDKAKRSNDDEYWDSVALQLHDFYSGIERLFEDVARSWDGNVPDDNHWHQALLQQMAASLPSVRPPVIQRETRACLENYRTFRHVVRNVYSFNLRPSRLVELASELPSCYESLRRDLNSFVQFLLQFSTNKNSQPGPLF